MLTFWNLLAARANSDFIDSAAWSQNKKYHSIIVIWKKIQSSFPGSPLSRSLSVLFSSCFTCRLYHSSCFRTPKLFIHFVYLWSLPVLWSVFRQYFAFPGLLVIRRHPSAATVAVEFSCFSEAGDAACEYCRHKNLERFATYRDCPRRQNHKQGHW